MPVWPVRSSNIFPQNNYSKVFGFLNSWYIDNKSNVIRKIVFKMLWYGIIWGRNLLQPPVPIKKKLPQVMNLKGWPLMCGLKQ